jgi:uncharacterized membrane protein YfcA
VSYDIFFYLLLGALSGLTGGLFGLGGGVTIVPGLLWVFMQLHFPASTQMHAAEGSSLATMIFTSLSSIHRHHTLKNIIWPIFKQTIPYIIVGVISGALIAWWLHGIYLTLIFSLYLLFVSAKMIRGQKKANTQASNSPTQIPYPWLGGGASGFFAGLLGVGGGTFSIPYLSYAKLQFKHAIGTSAAFTLPVAVVGTASYILFGIIHPDKAQLPWSTGFVYWPAVLCLAPASAIFAQIGAKLTAHIPAKPLKKAFGLFMLGIALWLGWQCFQAFL